MSAGRTNAAGGVQLPALTNPAAVANIQSGYQAINGDGEVVTGTAGVVQTVSGYIRSSSRAGTILCNPPEGATTFYLQNGDSYYITLIVNSIVVTDVTPSAPVLGMTRLAGDFNAYKVTDKFSLIL